jgi:hypothetical protein
MKFKNTPPKEGAKSFTMLVLPHQTNLDKAIELKGHCSPDRCWHKLEVAAIAHEWDPDGNHHVRVDAGHVKMNLWDGGTSPTRPNTSNGR